MPDTRSLFERCAAKVIDWMMRTLTPRTRYYKHHDTIIDQYASESEKEAVDVAILYLIDAAVERGCDEVISNIRGFVDRNKKWQGDWRLIIKRVYPSADGAADG